MTVMAAKRYALQGVAKAYFLNPDDRKRRRRCRTLGLGKPNRPQTGPIPLCSLSYICPERNPGSGVMHSGMPALGRNTVVRKSYFKRQATTLLKLAQSTSDPLLVAALVDKAIDLDSQVDEPIPPATDRSPLPPDVERPS
jgi:hypothetical protein